MSSVDITLTIGSVDQTIDVSAVNPLLDVQGSNRGKVSPTEAIRDLPLFIDGGLRSSLAIAILTPALDKTVARQDTHDACVGYLYVAQNTFGAGSRARCSFAPGITAGSAPIVNPQWSSDKPLAFSVPYRNGVGA